MENMIPCAIKDQEVFQRVWQRVMEGRTEESSPIQPIPGGWEGDIPCERLESLMRQGEADRPTECERQDITAQPMQPEAPAQPGPDGWQSAQEAPAPDQPVPEEPCGNCAEEGLPPEEGPHRENDLPRLWEEPQSADDRTARLRRHVMQALEGWQFYRHLARRTRGTDARTLNSLAGELHRQARKLSAAYFLITGLRYWPSELLGMPAIPSYWGALRARHQAEQRQESAFRLAADDWDDPDVLALYNELADSCQRRCQQMRSLLEQDIT